MRLDSPENLTKNGVLAPPEMRREKVIVENLQKKSPAAALVLAVVDHLAVVQRKRDLVFAAEILDRHVVFEEEGDLIAV